MLENSTDFGADSVEKLNGLAMVVLNKKASELSQKELKTLLSIDMMAIPKSLKVSVQDTRQVAQYTPNSYFAEMEISFDDIEKLLVEFLKPSSSIDETLNDYLSFKKMLRDYIKFKYSSIESDLRDMLWEAEKKDNLLPLGRYDRS